jgi:cytochrome c biogenesis protein CcdA/thiol-disulfide isomerase/thioredoxin
MFTLWTVSFLAGILTILAPCVLPVLPIVLAGSLSEKQKWYPYIVILSLACSVVLFTVLLKASTILIDIPPYFWKGLSGGILIALGCVYIFPHAWSWTLSKFKTKSSTTSLDRAQDIGNPFIRAIATWAALGPVFSTCSPTYAFLLATVFPVSFIAGIGYTFLYAFWLSCMLGLIALWWRSIIARFRGIADERGWFKRTLWIIFVLIGLSIITWFDKKVEIWVLDRFDVSVYERSVFDLIPKKISTPPIDIIPSIEPSGEPIKAPENTWKIISPSLAPVIQIPEINKVDTIEPRKEAPLPSWEKAPEIPLTEWIDSERLTMAWLKWKVVVIDFWTLWCINCQRTRPYLNAWYEKYRDQWLVIIGVHAPEFAYEKVRSNVEKAIKDQWIWYPVVLDPDFTLWNLYKNQYWPAFYFIDKQWYIRGSHFWEGAYDENEAFIKELLSE